VTRVAVVANAFDDETLYFIGYGVRGDLCVPPRGLGPLTDALNDDGAETPVIVLDSGEVLYGCECYYDDADAFDACVEGEFLESMTVAELREASRHEVSDREPVDV
jgi:hypothetical protein